LGGRVRGFEVAYGLASLGLLLAVARWGGDRRVEARVRGLLLSFGLLGRAVVEAVYSSGSLSEAVEAVGRLAARLASGSA